MRDREICCMYYTYENGPCDKRGISVSFRHECQKCSKYKPQPGREPARRDTRKQRLNKIKSKEMRDF